MRTLGLVEVRISKSGRTTELLTAYVIKNLQQPILSRQVLRELGIIPEKFPFVQLCIGNGANFGDESIEKLEEALRQARAKQGIHISAASTTSRIELGHGLELDKFANEFPEVFDNTKIPTINGGFYTIKLEETAIPFNKRSSRSVPEPCMEKLKKELELQLGLGLIKQVPAGEKSEWLHPIVVAPKKDGNIRLCVDLRMLNKFVKRPENPQRSPWEVVRTIPTGCKHFATFDAFKGYHQVELDPQSRKLTTFYTPFCQYHYVRLAMGLSRAGDVFTTRYGNVVDYRIEGRRCTEDTLIHGHTSEELARKTKDFVSACAEAGIMLNNKKISYDRPEVVFGGYLISEAGYSMDPSLTTALSEFPVPKLQTNIRSFCGLANQMCNFSDDISEALAPFKHLLKKGQKFEWNDVLQATFKAARRHLTSTKTLAFYRPDRKTRLITDASRLNGIGFVLKQEIDGIWKPVQAGSRSLTETEGRYAMVELELLAICWAVKKCANFINGLPLKLL